MKTFTYDEYLVGPWVCARAGGRFDSLCTGIGLLEDGELIAGVLYNGCNGRSVSAHIAIDGQITREFLQRIFDYPFKQLRVNVIIGTVDSENLAARRFDEKLGFKLLSVIPDAGPKGDMCVYVMRAEDCRWLHLKDRHGEPILKAR